MMPKTRPSHAPELRRQMVELVRAGGDPASPSREYKPSQAIRNWGTAADRAGGHLRGRPAATASDDAKGPWGGRRLLGDCLSRDAVRAASRARHVKLWAGYLTPRREGRGRRRSGLFPASRAGSGSKRTGGASTESAMTFPIRRHGSERRSDSADWNSLLKPCWSGNKESRCAFGTRFLEACSNEAQTSCGCCPYGRMVFHYSSIRSTRGRNGSSDLHQCLQAKQAAAHE